MTKSAFTGLGIMLTALGQVTPIPVEVHHTSDVNAGLPVTLTDGTRKYGWGLRLACAVDGSSMEAYHTDRLGSVRALADAGAATATYRTHEWGVPSRPRWHL